MKPRSGVGHESDEAFAREVERRASRQRLDVFLGSRDAGRELVSDGLHAEISTRTLVETAAGLADYADEAIAIVTTEYRPPLDCKAGCSFCCCKPGVLVSVPELLRIVDRVRTTLESPAIAGVRERARQYVDRLGGRHFDEPTNESFPCPLLTDGRCLVYEVRPLTCRGYNSTSVDACRRAHESTDVLVPIFSVIKDVTDGATVGAAQRLREIGLNDSMVDLGTALDIALGAGEKFSQAVATGEPALRPAENSSWVDGMWMRVRQTARTIGITIDG